VKVPEPLVAPQSTLWTRFNRSG